MKILTIPDDSGYIGLVNFDRYNSYIGDDWDFGSIKQRIIAEINSHNLLFWSTGLENRWKVSLDNRESGKDAFREDRGVLQVTNQKLYLTNYESLTMAAQFEDVQLPENHLKDLYVKLENGKYMVKFRQMFNPDEFDFESEEVNFEIIIQRTENHPEIYSNNVNAIFWSKY